MQRMDVGPLNIQQLLHGKALEPLNPAHLTKLQRIQTLDVSDYSEQDVREVIIAPMLEALGYAKGTDFSVDREKPVPAQGRNKFPDYRFTFWKEDFWVLEAKKPGPMATDIAAQKPVPPFAYEAIRQTLEYAVHPEINAALLVLCDGRNISVFDREVDIVEPVLTIGITNIAVRFNELRTLLGPWQMWFFEKRRVVRQLNKVFDKEFNLARVEEFKDLIEDTLDSKSSVIIENMRKVLKNPGDEILEAIQKATAEDLIEGFLPVDISLLALSSVSAKLVEHCGIREFPVLYRLFPDHPRPVNDTYCSHALHFLLRLGADRRELQWIPSWLGPNKSTEAVIKRYITLCLTYFEGEQAYRYILLASAALRRFYKLAMVADHKTWQTGELLHLAHRYTQREDTFQQLVSSPERHNILRLDVLEQDGIRRLVHECTRDGVPAVVLIKERLAALWTAELHLLKHIPDYKELLKQRGLDQEMHLTEGSSTVYDNLGHGALCVLSHNVDWKDYALKVHRAEVELLADIGSWSARELLGLDKLVSRPIPSAQIMANRFFAGDVKLYRTLGTAYGFQVS